MARRANNRPRPPRDDDDNGDDENQRQRPDESETPIPDEFTALDRLLRDLRAGIRLLGRRGARFFCDFYWTVQKFRTRAANQVKALTESGEPMSLLTWTTKTMETLEGDIKKALDIFSEEWAVGRWLKSLVGVGPVTATALLAHLDIRHARTAGHFVNFSGLNPDARWVSAKEAAEMVDDIMAGSKRVTDAHVDEACRRINRHRDSLQKALRFLSKKDDTRWTPKNLADCISVRPWNARLKTVLYNVGNCFIQFGYLEGNAYEPIYRRRREYEAEINARGGYAVLARKALAEKNYGKDTDARKWYEGRFPSAILENGWVDLEPVQKKERMAEMIGPPGSGVEMLPPGRMHLRGLRYMLKIFLSHVHHVMYVDYFQAPPPVPFAFSKSDGDHRHFILPPQFPCDLGGRSLRELFGTQPDA